jgi:hypothetical protein
MPRQSHAAPATKESMAPSVSFITLISLWLILLLLLLLLLFLLLL